MAVGAYRAMGPRNAALPQATGQVVGFLHDPSLWPYMNYVQLVPLPEECNGVYRYPIIEPDAPVQLVYPKTFGWGWDDKRPSGETFKPRVRWDSGQTSRYSFGWTLGERTQRAWLNSTKIDPKTIYDRMRLNQAMLLRASEAVDTVRGASFAAYNTSSLNTLLGTPAPAVYFDKSSGTELLPSGNPNPNFQIIKQAQNIIMRRIDLQCNGAVTGEEFVMVIGPLVAQAIAKSGEIVNYLKQQEGAKEDLMKRNKKWGVPDAYNGWTIVVEDTPRVFFQTLADGTTFASPTTATSITGSGSSVAYNQRDYIWNDDTIVFCSRAGGLDGNYGFASFSTFQMFHYNGLAKVTAQTDQWNEILEGAIDLEHQFKAPALMSGFKLTGTLSTLV